jgi:hypothetical protein
MSKSPRGGRGAAAAGGVSGEVALAVAGKAGAIVLARRAFVRREEGFGVVDADPESEFVAFATAASPFALGNSIAEDTPDVLEGDWRAGWSLSGMDGVGNLGNGRESERSGQGGQRLSKFYNSSHGRAVNREGEVRNSTLVLRRWAWGKTLHREHRARHRGHRVGSAKLTSRRPPRMNANGKRRTYPP